MPSPLSRALPVTAAHAVALVCSSIKSLKVSGLICVGCVMINKSLQTSSSRLIIAVVPGLTCVLGGRTSCGLSSVLSYDEKRSVVSLFERAGVIIRERKRDNA